jgi:hypothetical protein
MCNRFLGNGSRVWDAQGMVYLEIWKVYADHSRLFIIGELVQERFA